MTRNLRRSAVALLTVLACLTIMSTPASGVVVNATAAIASGNIRLQNGTSILDIPLGGGGGTGCGSTVGLDFDVDSTGTTGTLGFSSLSYTSRISYYTTTLILVLTYTSTPASGSITGSSTTGAAIISPQVRFKFEFFYPTNTSTTATDCAHGTTFICRYSNVTVMLSGTYNNDIHSIGSSDTISLTSGASSTLVALPCGPPFSTWGGGTLTFTSLGLHVLTP